MKRRLAVPIALRNVELHDMNMITKTRALRVPPPGDPEDYRILSVLAENKARIDRLQNDLCAISPDADCTDILNELEYLKADIELELLGVDAEVEDVPSSEDILSQEAEAVLA